MSLLIPQILDMEIWDEDKMTTKFIYDECGSESSGTSGRRKGWKIGGM